LNLLLSDGDARWFDDPGTGSYVEESLHWYRSTLAHTAPFVDGHSQPRVDGELMAFDDRDAAGWIRARAELAPGCVVRRTVVVMGDYLIDRVEWESDAAHELALPVHGVYVTARDGTPLVGEPAAIDGGDGREDGFAFLTDSRRLVPEIAPVRLIGHIGATTLDGWVASATHATWWSATAPGPPGGAPQPLVLVRSAARRGMLTGVWSWRSAVTSAEIVGDDVTVHRTDGAVHVHRQRERAWVIEGSSASSPVVELTPGAAMTTESAFSAPSARPPENEPTAGQTTLRLPFRRELGAEHYRRSEQSWEESGRPTATVTIDRARDRLLIHVIVPRAERRFVAIDAENPLDNDPAAIHGDGVQLYVDAGSWESGWLLVPIPGTSDVAGRVAEGWRGELPLSVTWRPSGDGYALTAEVTLPTDVAEFGVDVLVNESAPGRTRRRGQLVLSGAHREFVYLRAERHERERLLRFSLDRA
jgi:hypothetical protein